MAVQSVLLPRQEKINVYAKKSKNVVQAVNALRDLGADFDIDLPRICCCGNQSAGKSSLIEAISGIALPRSDGTCTRCPMEVRLSEPSDDHAPWQCTLTLHFTKDAKMQQLAKPVNFKFGDVILEKADVEPLLRRAQKALLNPTKFLDPTKTDTVKTYLEMTDEALEVNELKFTENTLMVEVVEKGIGDLTLIDLPGIIHATAATEDRHFITLVNDLVTKYIQNERTIIAAVVSCKEDLENQAIANLARQYDPDGSRTIFAFTKPDTIEPGCHEEWLKHLTGASSFKGTAFVVRNPSKLELTAGISNREARQNEQHFFTTEKPWSTLPSRNQLGVPHYQARLSQVLVSLIRKTFPTIRDQARKLLDATENDLNSLPKPVSNIATIELVNLARTFSQGIATHLLAEGGCNTFFRNEIDQPFQTLDSEIRATAPNLLIQSNTLLGEPQDTEGLTVRKVQRIIDEERGRPEFGNVPAKAAKQLLMDATAKWKAPANDCLDVVDTALANKVAQQAQETFGRFPALEETARECLPRLQQECKSSVETLLQVHFLNESRFPFTLDPPEHKEKVESYNAKFKETLLGMHKQAQQFIIQGLTATAKASLANDQHDGVINCVSQVLGYFDVACDRYIFNIARTIDIHFVLKFGEEVEKRLLQTFPWDLEQAEELLEEDGGVRDRRRELEEKQARLRTVWDQIRASGI